MPAKGPGLGVPNDEAQWITEAVNARKCPDPTYREREAGRLLFASRFHD